MEKINQNSELRSSRVNFKDRRKNDSDYNERTWSYFSA